MTDAETLQDLATDARMSAWRLARDGYLGASAVNERANTLDRAALAVALLSRAPLSSFNVESYLSWLDSRRGK